MANGGLYQMEDTMSQAYEPMLWLSDARGMYIPRDFATSFADRAKHVTGVNDETWSILEAGPDHEWYWEAWDDVCRSARVTDAHGRGYTVYQDGDCWLIPDDMEWSDETGFFVRPSEQETAAR